MPNDAEEVVRDVSVQAAGQVPGLADPVVVFTPPLPVLEIADKLGKLSAQVEGSG